MSSFSSGLDEKQLNPTPTTQDGPEAATPHNQEEDENLAIRNKAVKTSKELQLKRQAARDMGIKSNKTMQNILAPQETGPTQETEKKGRKTRKGDKE